jgi:hypothetical protein
LGWFYYFNLLNFIIAFSLENFKYNDVLDRIAKTVLVLGFIISISKEKIEDELIAKTECNPNYAVIGTDIFI